MTDEQKTIIIKSSLRVNPDKCKIISDNKAEMVIIYRRYRYVISKKRK